MHRSLGYLSVFKASWYLFPLWRYLTLKLGMYFHLNNGNYFFLWHRLSCVHIKFHISVAHLGEYDFHNIISSYYVYKNVSCVWQMQKIYQYLLRKKIYSNWSIKYRIVNRIAMQNRECESYRGLLNRGSPTIHGTVSLYIQ